MPDIQGYVAGPRHQTEPDPWTKVEQSGQQPRIDVRAERQLGERSRGA
jgi:hypothetical protein